MAVRTVAIQSPGDMGAGVGAALVGRGIRILTNLEGRSARSRRLAAAAGMTDVGGDVPLVAEADLVLSIVPPGSAVDTAARLAKAMKAAGATPAYADMNAISPPTAARVGEALAMAGAPYIDGGIIGSAPGKSGQPTRFYVAGPDAAIVRELAGEDIRVIDLGPQIGAASALKMSFAAVTKGSWTLYAAALLTAEAHGLLEPYIEELAFSRPYELETMRRMVPRLPLDATRWIPEMEEIAATLADAGLPSGFHEGAADVFRLLEKTPVAQETRQDYDTSRTLEQALEIYARYLPKKDAAE